MAFKRVFILAILFECAFSAAGVDLQNRINEISETIDLLRRGEQEINLSRDKDIVFVFGPSGAGKTAFTHFIAGDPSALRSMENGENTGEYIIEDLTNEKIAYRATSGVKTIFPELVIDEENTAFYDFPGFIDNKNASIELATAYFMRKIVRHAETVKIVFVVNYWSLVRGIGRHSELETFLHQASILLRNIDRYNSSISLVASRAESTPSADDTRAINKVVSFLQEYRQSLWNNRRRDRGKSSSFTTDALKLLDIFLSTTNSNYERIGLFKQPQTSGWLSDLPEMVENRKNLRTMINNHTMFIKKYDDDFGYRISHRNRPVIPALEHVLDGIIAERMSMVGRDIVEFYESTTPDWANLQEMRDKFERAHYVLADLWTDARSLRTKFFLQDLIARIQLLEIFIPGGNLTDILNTIDYLDFLHAIHGETVEVSPMDWRRSLGDCLDYLKDQKNWFEFIAELFERLSDYEVQKNTSRYNVADVELWGSGSDRNQDEISINETNFDQFLQKQDNYRLVRTITATPGRLDLLNNILNVTLKSKPTAECVDGKLTVRGHFVKLSDIDLICRRRTQIKSLDIFALFAVFIDRDIARAIDVTIIAPRWHVNGARVIALDGPAAEELPQFKAVNGVGPAFKAENGQPGLPGKNARNFFGIGWEFVNDESLRVSAIGGRGGRGQDGGDGYNSADVQMPTTLDLSQYRKYEFLDGADDPLRDFNEYVKRVHPPRKEEYKNFFIYADCAGNGGAGGRGGLGGLRGQVRIFDLDQKSNVRVVVQDGERGPNGVGGQRGHTAPKLGATLHISYDLMNVSELIPVPVVRTYSTEWLPRVKVVDYSCDELVHRGDDGTNENAIRQPKVDNRPPNYTFVLNKYKEFARRSRESLRVNADKVQDFLDRMENSSAVNDAYDTPGLVHDLFGLEKQFSASSTKTQFLEAYQSLADRTVRHLEKRNWNEAGEDYKKLLAHLHVAAFSKICSLRARNQPVLETDLQTYLDFVAQQVNSFDSNGRQGVMNEFKNYLRSGIEAKAEETSKFIATDILLELDTVNEQLNGQIDGLLHDAIRARANLTQHVEDFDKATTKLEKTLVLRETFQTIRSVAYFSSFGVSYGVMTERLIGASAQVPDMLLLDQSKAFQKPSQTMPGTLKTNLQKLHASIQAGMELKLKNLERLIGKISQAIDQQPDVMSDMSIALENIGREIEVLKSAEEDKAEGINAVVKEIERLLTRKSSELNRRRRLREEERQASDTLGKFAKQLELLDIAGDLYDRCSDDQTKLDVIVESTGDFASQLRELRAFEKEISGVIVSRVGRMLKLYEQVENMDSTASDISLDGTIWQKHIGMLNDVKRQLNKFTRASQSDDLSRTVDKLDDVLASLVNIYHRLEYYCDLEKLHDLFINIDSASAQRIAVDDLALSAYLLNLSRIIQSNTMLILHANAENAFRQTVFPFAKYFDHQIGLVAVNATDAAADVKTKLEMMKSLWNEYAAGTVNGLVDLVQMGNFTGDDLAMEPFFVWTQKQHPQVLDDLLTGRGITVRTDITKSQMWNVVKFKQLEINLKTTNETVQTELNRRLKQFDIRIIHHGNSHYRCQHQFYTMTSAQKIIEYSFDKDENDWPLRKNTVWDEIHSKGFVLSPYALLTIKLFARNPAEFNYLKQYKGAVDLELIGRGMYVSSDVDVCTGLDRYYRWDKTISEINKIEAIIAKETTPPVSPLMAIALQRVEQSNDFKNTIAKERHPNESASSETILRVRHHPACH